MRKNVKTLLCATALLGSMSALFVKAAEINSGDSTDFNTIESFAIDSVNQDLDVNTDITVGESGGLTGIARLNNNSAIENNGTITDGGIVAQTIVNNSGASITGGGGLSFGSGTSINDGMIEQGIINITGGSFINNNSVTANGTFTNNSFITGDSGNLNINAGGSSSQKITQGNVTIGGGTFANNSMLEAKTNLTNKGSISGTGNITTASLDNQSGKTISGTGSLTVNGGSNSGTITKASMETRGNFTNTGNIGTDSNKVNLTNSVGTLTNSSTINADTLANVGGKITNNGTITAVTFNNSAAVDGSGTANIGGGINSSTISQDIVNITGNYVNNYSITANNEFNNNSYNLSGSGNLSVTDTTGNSSNGGTISQNNITLGGTKFTNNGTMTANGTFTNNTTLEGANGVLNVENGGSSGKAISQKNISIKGLFSNNAKMTSTNDFQNAGTISGTGSLEVKNGSNNGTIEQAITNSGNFTNSNTISGAVENNGTYINNGTISGDITNDGTSFTNNNIITGNISNEGGTFTNGTDGKIGDTSHKVNITNNTTFTNNGSIVAGEIANNTGASFTNNNTIIADTLNNGNIIDGANGTLTINTDGTNNGSITQNKVTVVSGATFTNGNGTNNASINAAIENSGTFENKANSTIGSTGNKASITNKGTFKNFGNVIASLVKNENGKTLTNDESIITDSVNNEGTVSGTGALTTAGGTNSGSITQNSLTNSGVLNHSGSIVANTITNGGTIQGIAGTNGSLTLNNGTSSNTGSMTLSGFTNGSASTLSDGGNLTLTGNSSNEGTISQGTIAVTGGTFTNNNDVTAAAFNNSATVDGTGNFTISGGTNTGSIKQTLLTFDGTYDNQKKIEAEVVNTGNFTNNTQGSIIGKITNSNLFRNKGQIGAEGSENKIINNHALTNDASGKIFASTITNGTDKAFANNGRIKANIFNNDGTVNGTGSLDVAGGKNSSSKNFTQGTLHLTGDYTNEGNMTATKEFTNDSALTGGGNLSINDTTGNSTNSGTISQTGVTVAGKKFTNSNTITTTGAFTNRATELANSSTITSGGVFTNSGKISGENGILNINAGGSSTGEIVQNTVTISGDFSNGAKLQAGTLTNHAAITNTSEIIADIITNDASINGGNITIGTGSNEGTISAAIAKVTGDLENTGDFTASSFTNGANFTGAGNLVVNNGTNNGTIEQNNLTVNTLLTNNEIITVENVLGNGRIDLAGDASLTAKTQTNPLTAWIKSIGSGKTNTVDVNGDISGKLTADAGSTLELTKGNVREGAIVEVTSGSTLDLKGTSVSAVLNNNDTWDGKVELNGADLTVKNRTSNGVLLAKEGNLTAESGILQIGSGSVIENDVTTKINSAATLDIQNGGKVTLNAGDDWSGKIVLGSGDNPEVADIDNLPEGVTTLDVSGLSATGTLLANNGYLKLGDKDLDIQGESYIEKAVAMELGGNIKVSNGGRVAIDDNDKMTGANPKVTLSEGGTLNYGKTVDSGLNIEAAAGNLNLLSGSNLTFKEGSIADAVAIDIQQNANLRLEGSTLNLNNEDKWNGKIWNNGGVVNANGLISTTDTAALEQNSGELNIYNDASLILGSNGTISGGEINITKGDKGTKGSVLSIVDANIIGGNMTIDKDSAFVVKSGTFTLDSLVGNGQLNPDGTVQAALVNTINGDLGYHVINNLTSNTQTDFNIDVYARQNGLAGCDEYEIASLNGNGKLFVNDWKLNGDIYGWDAPIDRYIKLDNIFHDENDNAILSGNIAVTDKTTFTPIGWYKLNKHEQYNDIFDENGILTSRTLAGTHYSLDLVKYNPQVFRGQVATVAQWMNQLAIDDMLFTHSMVLPSFKDENGDKPSNAMANRYAAINPLFAPYQYSIKDGGLWYKMYGTFENLEMNNGLGSVGNNSYGALIGADFGLKEIKNGWKFMPTAYIGYNGAHQYWSKMGQYQNGGQAGFMGTWYKNNVILSSLTYAGVYDNQMDVFGHSENTFNYFAGTAAKAAYNWRFHRDWVLQPNLMAAYNYFGQQNWHSNFGQMGMMAGMLHGVNIAPGVNLIWEKETFSTYLTLQYMYNINGASGGRAGNVGLPQIEMDRGYIQYGIGFKKQFGDRFSGYLQAVLRNVGRTGVGFQAGFNIKLGK